MKRAYVDLTYIRGSIPHGKLGPTAKALGIQINTLSRKLRGERPLTVDELNGIADFLGMSVDQFLRLKEVAPTKPTQEETSVLALFREGEISAGKAAELLGITRWEFMDRLSERGIPMADETPEEMDEGIAALERLLKERDRTKAVKPEMVSQ